MTEEKEKLLNDALEKAIKIGFGLVPSDEIEAVFAPGLIIIGTAAEEKYTSLEGLRNLIQLQQQQSAGMQLSYNRKEFYRDLHLEDVAIIVEDIRLDITMATQVMGFDMRASSVFEYKDQQWKVIHWHVSKPDPEQSNEDTFGVEEWKQKTEALEKIVAERTAELRNQKEALEHALEDLRSTQSQLIQSEKMASLGELTAGIAHEIQNPLNFVNNFSEVSTELLEEMQTELLAGHYTDAKEIADDVKQNLEKINHHGKRADAIVKGMLQHSRNSSGQKESTDINALCDEYLRLSYHGLRAKDKTFNAAIETDFDESIGKINVVPQEIGRVILNLLTNAFYAVNKLQASLTGTGYQPTVSIRTKKTSDKVLIQVRDNGTGIPTDVIEKIFQPFFTTKPTGQGTGLGLSMSYDIITKGHNGELTLTSRENEGTTFNILLPI